MKMSGELLITLLVKSRRAIKKLLQGWEFPADLRFPAISVFPESTDRGGQKHAARCLCSAAFMTNSMSAVTSHYSSKNSRIFPKIGGGNNRYLLYNRANFYNFWKTFDILWIFYDIPCQHSCIDRFTVLNPRGKRKTPIGIYLSIYLTNNRKEKMFYLMNSWVYGII